jgi:hypothetical protein
VEGRSTLIRTTCTTEEGAEPCTGWTIVSMKREWKKVFPFEE